MADSTKALTAPGDTRPGITELKELVRRARLGDESVIPQIRRLVSDSHFVRIFGGELAETAIRSVLDALSGSNRGAAEAVQLKLTLMRDELLGPNPTPVERLLVERVVACWLQIQDAEIRWAQGQPDASVKWADFCQRRMSAANKRFLAAVKALALVRKLAVPVLQVNIAERQINVATPPVPTAPASS